MFTTYGGMIIHLEAGNCSQAVNIVDLNYAAVTCHDWRRFIQGEYHRLLMKRKTNYLRNNKVRPFKCPTCATTFTKLSAMFQHIESPACPQRLNDWPISTLRNRLSHVITRLHQTASDITNSESSEDSDYWC